jgi:hypothetical protein
VSTNPGLTLLLPVLLLGSSGCCSLKSEYARALRQEASVRLEAPASARADGGRYHLGFEVKLDAVQKVLNQKRVLEALPGFKKTIGIGPAGLEVSARIHSLILEASTGCENCLRIEAGIVLEVEAKAAGLPLSSLGLPTSIKTSPAKLILEAGMHAEPLGKGRTALKLDLSRPVVRAFDYMPELLPGAFSKLAKEMAVPIARVTLSSLEVAVIEPLDLGVGKLALSLASVETDAKQNSLRLGLMTNLDLPVSAWVGKSKSVLQHDVRLRLSSRLPEVSVKSLLSAGAIPRSYSSSIEPEKNGPLKVTLNRMDLAENEVRTSFRIWHVSWPCFHADLLATGEIGRNERGRFTARIKEVELEHATDYEDRIKKKLWKVSEFSKALETTSEKLLNERYLQFSGDIELVWSPVSYRIDSDTIEIEGRIGVRSGPG